MSGKIISIFNNKGGVGKTVIAWNIADSLADLDKNVLIIDFDPQCNLSLAFLGENQFVNKLPTENIPYGQTCRSYLQRFLQNTGGEEIFIHRSEKTNHKVGLIAGDFWLNVYADLLNVGSDLLTGAGLSKYVVLRKMIEAAEEKSECKYDYVLIDLPPSFGAIVRAALYSSDYFIVPCTSDNFSVYCVGLIGQMIPVFLNDWQDGLARFSQHNPNYSGFNDLGRPAFAGWIFNGFDSARERRTREEKDEGIPMKEKKIVKADQTMHDRLVSAIRTDLVGKLQYFNDTSSKTNYKVIADNPFDNFRIGDIEDANVLIQNSLWQNVPLGKLASYHQITTLQDRIAWSENQREQIKLFCDKYRQIACNIISICV